MLAEAGGDFVCATAGHHMESMLAAYGSGASLVSNQMEGRILNIDIGGGTTKLALLERGRVIATAAVHIGGRLQVVDGEGRIVRLDPAGRTHARRAGFDWRIGDCVEDGDLDSVADAMADTLVAALSPRIPDDAARLYLTDPLPSLENIAGVMASGGVPNMSTAAKRATSVIWAGAWAARSGADSMWARCPGRSFQPASASVPPRWARRNTVSNSPAIRATSPIRVRFCRDAIYKCSSRRFCLARLWTAMRWQRPFARTAKPSTGKTRTQRLRSPFIGMGAPSYERIFACARGIAAALADKVAAKKPIYVMLDGDIAHTLGAILREDCQVMSDILCIDGVMLMDFDYIDLGRVRVPSYTVPVTIKSLVFSDDPKRTHQRIHHHHDDLPLPPRGRGLG